MYGAQREGSGNEEPQMSEKKAFQYQTTFRLKVLSYGICPALKLYTKNVFLVTWEQKLLA